MSGAPVEVRHAKLDAKRARERELHHVERSLEQRMRNLALPKVREPRGSVRLMANHRGRAFVRRPVELAQPDREAVKIAARQTLQAARLPTVELECGLAVETIEVLTDERGFLHAHTIVANEVRHAAGRVDAVVRAASRARLRNDDFDAAAERFFDD